MKKNLYLSVICLGSVCFAQAQIIKGGILLGGSLGANHTSSVNTYTTPGTSIFVYPSIGKAVKDNLVLGVNLSYGYVSNNNQSLAYRTDYFGVGGFVRKYRPLGTSGFSVFVEGNLNLQYARDKEFVYPDASTTAYPAVQKTYSVTAAFSPGIAYAISKHVMVESSLFNMAYIGYSNGKTRYTPETGGSADYSKSSTFTVSTNLNQLVNALSIGVKFVI